MPSARCHRRGTPRTGGDVPAVRNYDIGRQEVLCGRMPTLEIINERFARNLRVGLFNFMRRSAEISVGPVRVLKYSEFIRNLVVPTNLNMIHSEAAGGTALFILTRILSFWLSITCSGQMAGITFAWRVVILP